MRLTRVTITGADDSTEIGDLQKLSVEFPFVEWAILVSRSQEGRPRFPSRAWTEAFVDLVADADVNVAMHMCGAWVRELLTGELKWEELPTGLLAVAKRIQINTHAEPHLSKMAMISKLSEQSEKTFIFQWDGVNDHLAYVANSFNLSVNALYDSSHGTGILPQKWESVRHIHIPCGYAGGLGPENLLQELPKIAAAAGHAAIWIDMERRVRTDDDSALDLDKVRRVLEITRVARLNV